MKRKSVVFTIKIYGEGLTEWFYLDWLKSTERFSFKLEPAFPTTSRSSYKKRLSLIDKELKRPVQERANLLVLITDLDNIMDNQTEYRCYLEQKRKYEAKGVIFVESHPSIELWFYYHFTRRYEKSNYATYDEIKNPLRDYLHGYEKSKAYYSSNTVFKKYVLDSYEHRISAADRAIASCRYVPQCDELVNRTNMHELILFLHMLQFSYVISDILKSKARVAVDVELDVCGLDGIKLIFNGCHLLTFKRERSRIVCCTSGKRIDFPLDFDYNNCSDEIRTFLVNLEELVNECTG